MVKRNYRIRLLSVALAIAFVIGTWGSLPGSGSYAAKGAAKDAVSIQGDAAAEWQEIQDIVGQYNGVWNDSSYPGLITNRVPNTALLGNGDVGIASGGDATSKNYYISKSDFWRYKGSPVLIGGLKIEPVVDEDPAPVSLIQGKTATANSSHGSFPASRAVSGAWAAGYEGWVSNADRTNAAASTADPWILTVDAGEEITFNRYVVRHDGAARPAETGTNTKEFGIEISSDGAAWTEIDKVVNNTAPTTDKTFQSAFTARYIRLKVYKGIQSDTASNPRARIGQFELYLDEDAIGPINLALGKPASASSVHDAFTPDRAVNGLWTSQQQTGNAADRYEGWVSQVSTTSVPWLRVDLEQPTEFDHFIVKFDEASRVSTSGDNTAKKTAKEFEIQTSDNDTDWTTVWSVQNNTRHTVDAYLEDAVTARYVRVYLTVPNQQIDDDTRNNPRGCIGQFELYLGEGPDDGSAELVDLARGKTATASAVINNTLLPSRAVDGGYSYRSGREGWASGANAPQWWMVDLGEPTTFNRWFAAHDGAVRNQQDNNPAHFQILGSNNGEDWDIISDIDNNTAELNDVVLDAPVTYRYVRFLGIRGTQEETGGMVRLGAFRLYNMNDLAQDITGDTRADGYTYYTLDSAKKAGSLSMNAGAEAAQNVVLQFSKDGQRWKNALSVPSVLNSTVTEFGPFKAKYWRIKASAGAETLKLFPSDKPEVRTSSLHEVEDILNAEVRTNFMYDDNKLDMRAFMSATENLLVTEVTSGNDEPIDVSAQLWAASNNASTFPFTASAQEGSVSVSRTANPASQGDSLAEPYYTKAVLESKILGADFATNRDSNSEASMTFTIDPGQTVYIVTAIGGGGQVYKRSDGAQGALFDGVTEPDAEAAELLTGIADADDVEALENAHDGWWKDYWMQSYVKLGSGGADFDTIMKYYYAAQYMLGSCIREGNVAAGLYGIWHTNDSPSWNSDYHLNYNFISTYYGVASSNRPELDLPPAEAMLDYGRIQGRWNGEHTSFIQQINNQFVNYKVEKGDIDETAGVEGAILTPVGVGPFGMSLDNGLHSEALNAGFSIYPMVEYYNFTRDDEWLENSGVYDYIKGCLTFYESWLEETPDKYEGQGKYLLYAGYNEGSWSIDPAVELATVKSLINNAIRFSEILGVDAEKRTEWKEILDGLSPQPTIEVGGKRMNALAALEWPGYRYGNQENAWTTADDQWRVMTSPLPGDGNSIPLEAVMPGEIIGYYSDADTLETAQNTIGEFDRRNQWGQINNFPKMFTQAVNIRYNPELIIQRFASTIRGRMVANMMIEDNTHGVEKAGAVEAVNNMLLNSDQGVAKVFPNWPSNQDASFTRLREKGAFVVSASYDGAAERVEYVDIYSEAGKPMTIAAPWEKGVELVDDTGTAVAYTSGTAPNHDEEAVITFNTEAGKTYRLTEAQEPDVDGEVPGGEVPGGEVPGGSPDTSGDGNQQATPPTASDTAAQPMVTAIRTPLKTLYLKKSTQLTPAVCVDTVDANGNAGTGAPLVWNSSNSKVATVNAKGTISAKKIGKANITATAQNGRKLVITVRVVKNANSLKAVSLKKPPKSMAVGAVKQLALKIAPTAATNLKPVFKSSNKNVISVDKAGRIKALKKGKAKVTVTIGKKKYAKIISVA